MASTSSTDIYRYCYTICHVVQRINFYYSVINSWFCYFSQKFFYFSWRFRLFDSSHISKIIISNCNEKLSRHSFVDFNECSFNIIFDKCLKAVRLMWVIDQLYMNCMSSRQRISESKRGSRQFYWFTWKVTRWR